MSKSLYKILEVSENSTISEIKKSYRNLAKKYHPDVNKDKEAEEKFKEINSAYEILGDKKKKEKYDQYGDNMFDGQNFHDFYQTHEDIDLNDILRQMFNGNYSGGFGGFSHQYEEPDIDIEAILSVDIEKIKNGGKMEVGLSNGDKFNLNIPKDIKNNDKMKIKGKGNTNSKGETGDLYVYIKAIGNDSYEIDGDDIYTKIEIPLKIAIFGGNLKFDFMGEEITVKVPEGIQNQKKLRVKKKGVGNKDTKNIGDLYLITNIEIPKGKSFNKKTQKILKDNL